MPLNVLKESPLDSPLASPAEEPAQHQPSKWVPSRYNIHGTTEDGHLLLWNSLSGSMNVWKPDRAAEIKPLLRRPGFTAVSEGIVKYLVDRGYLVLENTNEYRQVQLAFGQKQYRSDGLELILLASEDCNFRCQYCYEDFPRGTMQPWVRDAVKQLLTKRIHGLQYLTISYFGGEPLYGIAAIEDLAPFCQELAQTYKVPLSSGMTTNGYLLTPETADKLLSWQINYFQITLDGAPEDHDCRRPGRDGSGTFDSIFANLVALKARPERYSVDLRVNFDRQNHRNMDRFFDLVEREFRDDRRFHLRFRAVGRWGGANDQNLDVCGKDESRRVREMLEAEALRRGLAAADTLRKINYSGSEVCYAARPYNLIVGASGKLMKCTVVLDKEDYNVVGAISPDGELTLNNDRMALWTEPAFESDAGCKKCVVLPVCHGMHCPLVRIEEHRSPCTPLRMHVKQELVKTYVTREREIHEAAPAT
jgi:uncharacterized protein